MTSMRRVLQITLLTSTLMGCGSWLGNPVDLTDAGGSSSETNEQSRMIALEKSAAETEVTYHGQREGTLRLTHAVVTVSKVEAFSKADSSAVLHASGNSTFDVLHGMIGPGLGIESLGESKPAHSNIKLAQTSDDQPTIQLRGIFEATGKDPVSISFNLYSHAEFPLHPTIGTLKQSPSTDTRLLLLFSSKAWFHFSTGSLAHAVTSGKTEFTNKQGSDPIANEVLNNVVKHVSFTGFGKEPAPTLDKVQTESGPRTTKTIPAEAVLEYTKKKRPIVAK